MKLKYLFFLLVVGFSSCQSRDEKWKTLDFGSFTLTTSSDWNIIKEKGIDSYIGGLTNGPDTLFFDYGWYSPSVGDEDPQKHKIAIDTVNGLLANIVIPIEDDKGTIGMSISQFKDQRDKFIIGGTDISGTEVILKIFKSLKFPESDTSQNPPLTLNKFILSPSGSGKQLYQIYCSSCHIKYRDATGPALNNIMSKRTLDWTYKFLTDRNSLRNDTAYLLLTKGQEYHCSEFPKLTRQEV